MDEDDPVVSKRFFWWDADSLTFPRKIFYRGGDENCNTTVGLRLPGGVLFLCLNIPLRQADSPPCTSCEPWETPA